MIYGKPPGIARPARQALRRDQVSCTSCSKIISHMANFCRGCGNLTTRGMQA